MATMGNRFSMDVASFVENLDEDDMIELVVALLRRLKKINGAVFYRDILFQIGLEEKEE